MSVYKPKFVIGEIYHIYNRGVEKKDIFRDESDYFEMAQDLYDMNDIRTLNFVNRHRRRAELKPQTPLIEILAFVLMSNHYHLLIRQLEENGASRFMQKFGTGYAMYFNKKFERVGPLFQNRFRAIHVGTQDYLRDLIGYLHTNPFDAIPGTIYNSSALDILKKYPWSSLPDYLGTGIFPSVTSRNFILEVMGGKEGIIQSVIDWIKYRKDNEDQGPALAKAGP